MDIIKNIIKYVCDIKVEILINNIENIHGENLKIVRLLSSTKTNYSKW